MEIIQAEKSHIPALIGLLKQVGNIHHQGRPDLFRNDAQKYSASQLEQILQDETRPVFVAVDGSNVLGYCFCEMKVIQDHPVLSNHKSLYIDDLCVDKSCRGKKVGSALYDHVRAYAQAAAFDSITLNVWAFNKSAMAFYRRVGMQERNIYMEMKLGDH